MLHFPKAWNTGGWTYFPAREQAGLGILVFVDLLVAMSMALIPAANMGNIHAAPACLLGMFYPVFCLRWVTRPGIAMTHSLYVYLSIYFFAMFVPMMYSL